MWSRYRAHTGAARASVATSAAQSCVCARAPGGADRSQPGRALTAPHAGRPATMFAIIALDTVGTAFDLQESFTFLCHYARKVLERSVLRSCPNQIGPCVANTATRLVNTLTYIDEAGVTQV
ncbi:unnamed protein product [Chrysodeixis includens]|uniref:Uncharacterized protein n=1 Tax=Chrysodeixis includens TaxID=689277 RepID=A0A9N8KS18_CHRIL|nr:unnamed protein product [Chrysodeixis includens]